MNYLVVTFKARKINMLQHTALFSAAPVFAGIMAMYSLDYKLKQLKRGLNLQGVGIVHRNTAPWMEVTYDGNGLLKTPVQRRGAYLIERGRKDKKVLSSMLPMVLADLEWTMILAVESRHVDINHLSSILGTMRIAGGDIDENSIKINPLLESLKNALGTISSGFWIEDASDLLDQYKHRWTSLTPVGKLLEICLRENWVVPANLGYALLERPVRRNGSREGYEHAFAENMIGLVRFVPMSTCRDKIEPEMLWRWGWDGNQFLVTNRPGVVLRRDFTDFS